MFHFSLSRCRPRVQHNSMWALFMIFDCECLQCLRRHCSVRRGGKFKSKTHLHSVNALRELHNHSLMPSLSPIPFVGFRNNVLWKDHILGMLYKMDLIVRKEGFQHCTLCILLEQTGNMAFLEGDVLFCIKVDYVCLDNWILGSVVKITVNNRPTRLK